MNTNLRECVWNLIYPRFFFSQGLSVHWSVVHFQMNINNNDNIDMVIAEYLSSDKYQNEWAAARNWTK